MGQSHSLSVQIEIEAPPETVRSVVLDFQRYKEFHQVFTIQCLDPEMQPEDLQAGDKLDVDIKGYSFKFRFQPTLVENSPSTFQWYGSAPFLFSGKHQFFFSPSQETPGGTTLIQREEFNGLLAHQIEPSWAFGKQTRDNFQTFNQDVKAEAERVAGVVIPSTS
ncbi:unnamed protein product [Clonostachys rosea]|uniref:Coenzyme Q-binding protein COQ10 START domain-containing protein n=1 Tax=Bionectria ochroleuca TaxID=29856 RepID=A0ABY6U6N3_BIOOC|nr:unnamed protein product [Clonostachys rosea]